MATTNVVNASLLVLYLENVEIGHCQNVSINRDMDTRDITTKESGGNKEYLPAGKGWSVECSGLVAFDDSLNLDELRTYWNDRTALTVKVTTDVSGDTYEYGEAYITSMPTEAGTEDNYTYSLTLQGTGALSTKTLT